MLLGNANGHKVFRQILLTPGKVISLSILNQKGIFRKTAGITGKALMDKIANEIPTLKLGIIETFTIPANKTKVIITK